MNKNFNPETNVKNADDSQRNIVLCKVCLAVLESTHRHDFVQCGCENHTFTDGGMDYQRIGGKDLGQVEVIESPHLPDPMTYKYAFQQEGDK